MELPQGPGASPRRLEPARRSSAPDREGGRGGRGGPPLPRQADDGEGDEQERTAGRRRPWPGARAACPRGALSRHARPGLGRHRHADRTAADAFRRCRCHDNFTVTAGGRSRLRSCSNRRLYQSHTRRGFARVRRIPSSGLAVFAIRRAGGYTIHAQRQTRVFDGELSIAGMRSFGCCSITGRSIFQQGEFRLVPSTGSYVAAVDRRGRHGGHVPDLSRCAERRARRGTGSSWRAMRVGDPRARALLPLPAGARREGGRAPAELPRRPRSTTRGACRSPTGTTSRAARSSGSSSPRRDVGAAEAALGPLRAAHVPVLVGGARGSAIAADLTFAGAQTQHRRGARWRAPGARRPAARRPRRGDATAPTRPTPSLTDALLAMKAAVVPVFTVGVGREALAQGRADRSGVDAPHRPQGHVAHDRRRRHADRLRRARPSRSTSRTKAGSSDRRR